MVEVSVRQHHRVEFVEGQGFWGREVRHRVGVARDVDADVDHHPRFVGGHQVARTSDFTVRAEGGHTRPRRTWTRRPVDVEAEILQQLTTLGGVGFAVATDVVDGLGQHRRCALDTNKPTGGVTDFVEHRTPATNGFSGIVANEGNLTKAGVEVGVLQAR